MGGFNGNAVPVGDGGAGFSGNYTSAEAPAAPVPGQPKSFASHASDALSEFGSTVGGAVTGTAKALTDIPGFFESWIKENQAIGDKAVDAFKNGRYAEGATHFANLLANTIPGMGTASEQTADDLKNGDYGKAVGRLAAIATLAKAPDLVSQYAPKVVAGAKAAAPDVAAGSAKMAGAVAIRYYLPGEAGYIAGIPAWKGGSQIMEGLAKGAKAASETPGGGGTILDRIKAARSTPTAEATPAVAAEPPIAGPLDQLTDYFKGKVEQAIPRGASDVPAEAPAGKQPLSMPSQDSGVIPSKTFTAKQYEEAARVDKSQKLAKSLNDSGVDRDELIKALNNPSADRQAIWAQAAQEASDYYGEPVNPPSSPASEAKTLFELRRYNLGADSKPISFQDSQNPDIAENLKQGARRTRPTPDGPVNEVLRSVPIKDVAPLQENRFFDATSARYRDAIRGRAAGYTEVDIQDPDVKPPLEGDYQPPTNREIFRQSAIHPTLIKSSGGEYMPFEGNHRFAAQAGIQGDSGSVLAWVPEENLAPTGGPKVSAEMLKKLKSTGAYDTAAQLASMLSQK